MASFYLHIFCFRHPWSIGFCPTQKMVPTSTGCKYFVFKNYLKYYIHEVIYIASAFTCSVTHFEQKSVKQELKHTKTIQAILLLTPAVLTPAHHCRFPLTLKYPCLKLIHHPLSLLQGHSLNLWPTRPPCQQQVVSPSPPSPPLLPSLFGVCAVHLSPSSFCSFLLAAHYM